MMLEHHIHPSPPNPEIERMHQRSREYSSIVRRRFLETAKPGTIGTMGGTGHIGTHEGVPFGRQGFQYWDEKALVHQSLQSFDGQEIEVMERLSFSPDRTKLFVRPRSCPAVAARCDLKKSFRSGKTGRNPDRAIGSRNSAAQVIPVVLSRPGRKLLRDIQPLLPPHREVRRPRVVTMRTVFVARSPAVGKNSAH